MDASVTVVWVGGLDWTVQVQASEKGEGKKMEENRIPSLPGNRLLND